MSHDVFKKALKFTLSWEGGYSNDPADPGHMTMRGITQDVFNVYLDSQFLPRRPVLEITDEELNNIYFEEYWIKSGCEGFTDNKMSVCHFDCAVNTGVTRAVKILQCVVGVKDDGKFGAKTLSAVLSASGKSSELIQARKDFYAELVKKNKNLEKFYNGWINRCVALEKLEI